MVLDPKKLSRGEVLFLSPHLTKTSVTDATVQVVEPTWTTCKYEGSGSHKHPGTQGHQAGLCGVPACSLKFNSAEPGVCHICNALHK